MKIAKLAVRIGSLTLISRMFGYVRDITIAFFLGASIFNDAFIIALRLPNVFRSIFGEGAFSNTFVPIFSKKLIKENQKSALKFAANVQSILLIAVILFCLIMMFFMSDVVRLIAPGYSHNSQIMELANNLGLISFPYIIFISMMAFYGGISNSLGNYFPMASAPIILNILLIFFVFLGNTQVQKTYWLTISLPIAGIFEMLWVMYFTFKRIGPLKLTKPSIDPDSKLLFKRIVPGIIGSGITQINVLVSTIIASYVASGVSYLYYADRIYQLPLALIGTALGTVMLPELAKRYSHLNITKFQVLQNQAIIFSMYAIIPVVIVILGLSKEIITVLFQYGAFDEVATQQTAAALSVFAIGLPAYCYIKIFSAAFFSSGDTKTPVKIFAFSLIINICLSLLLLNLFKHVAVAIGSVVSSYFTVFLMYNILHKRQLFILYNKTFAKLIKFLIISGGLYIIILITKYMIVIESKIISLIIILMIAGITYVCLTTILKVYSLKKLFKK